MRRQKTENRMYSSRLTITKLVYEAVALSVVLNLVCIALEATQHHELARRSEPGGDLLHLVVAPHLPVAPILCVLRTYCK